MTDSDRPGGAHAGDDGDEPWTPSGPWSRDRTTAFLAETQVPIRLSCRTPEGGLWMLSLWYEFRDDAIWCATAASADVVAFLEHDPRIAFEVSVNQPPYRGVRGQGRATVDPDPDKTVLESLLARYLGETDSSLAQRLLDRDREEVRIRIDPTRVATWDYSARMGDGQESVRDDAA